MRVRLVVTGDLERLALGPSLESILRAAGANVHFDTSFKAVNGAMTTAPLRDPSDRTLPVPAPVRRMANALVTETLIRRPLPDLVVGIDDLELANAHQPEVVVAWLRRALREVLDEKYPPYPSRDAAELARAALRARCSFHLLVPLVETYFFAEPAALTRAGVAAGVPVHRVGDDVEKFETNDPLFLPLAMIRNAEMAARQITWWCEERHPKRYLEFLVERSGGLYDETRGGREALKGLDWPAVGAEPEAARFARSLFEDLAEWLGIPNPLGSGTVAACTYPERTVRRETLSLRNI